MPKSWAEVQQDCQFGSSWGEIFHKVKFFQKTAEMTKYDPNFLFQSPEKHFCIEIFEIRSISAAEPKDPAIRDKIQASENNSYLNIPGIDLLFGGF